MITPSLRPNISFRVETIYPKGRVGVIKPDERGVYRGLPMMMLGEITQQKTYYDPESVIKQITSPDTTFNKIFTNQKLMGEYGHPTFYDLNSDTDKLQRLCTVDESKASHLFTSLYTDQPASDGSIVVRADIKPTGPYGAVLKDSLDDPIVNTSFSLRAFVDTNVRPDGVKYRTVKSLTTFDAVGASGFKNSDKGHALALESFSGDTYHDYEINVMKDGTLVIDQIALESFHNTNLNEIFGTNDISKISQSRTFVKADKSLMERFPNLYKHVLFQDYFKDI